MKCILYIEALAWVLLVGITGLLAFLWLAHSIQLIDQADLWGVFSSYWRFVFFVPAASATILGCQAQRPLAVRRPFWVRLLLAPLAVSFAFVCLVPLQTCLIIDPWWNNQLASCAIISSGVLALALSMLHPAFWNSALSATVLAAGLLSPLLIPDVNEPPSFLAWLLLIPSLLYSPTVLGLYAASLVLRRA